MLCLKMHFLPNKLLKSWDAQQTTKCCWNRNTNSLSGILHLLGDSALSHLLHEETSLSKTNSTSQHMLGHGSIVSIIWQHPDIRIASIVEHIHPTDSCAVAKPFPNPPGLNEASNHGSTNEGPRIVSDVNNNVPQRKWCFLLFSWCFKVESFYNSYLVKF